MIPLPDFFICLFITYVTVLAHANYSTWVEVRRQLVKSLFYAFKAGYYMAQARLDLVM